MFKEFFYRNKNHILILVILTLVFIAIAVYGFYLINKKNQPAEILNPNYKNNTPAVNHDINQNINNKENNKQKIEDFLNNQSEAEKNMTAEEKEARKQKIINFLNK